MSVFFTIAESGRVFYSVRIETRQYGGSNVQRKKRPPRKKRVRRSAIGELIQLED